MAKLQYGMIGGGPGAFIGAAHRKALAMDAKAELVAGCFSRTHEKTLETGQRFGIEADRCYTDFKEMAKAEAAREDGIDFVVITTPNSSHYDAAKAFLEAGINVVCEKPVTTKLETALELKKLAEEKDLLFMVAYTYTGHVTAKNIREIIKAGEIGEVRTVMGEYPQGWLAFENDHGGKQGAWRTDPDLSGRTNALGDIGTHIENMVATMTGLKIKKVLAKMDVVCPGRVLDDNDFVMVEYDNGASGMYWSSQVAIGHDNSLRVRIYGSKGSIWWFQEECEKFNIVDADGTIKEYHRGHAQIKPEAAKFGRLPSGHTEGLLESIANVYRSYMECVEAKKNGTFTPDMIDYPTIDDGIAGLKYVEACLESNEKGNVWINID